MKLLLIFLTIVAIVSTGVAIYISPFLWLVGINELPTFAAFAVPAISLDIACVMLWAKVFQSPQP
jgi:hypothetical protein